MSNHSPKFLELVDALRKKITECSVHDVKKWQEDGKDFILIDVREDNEWAKSHLPQAIHIGKGIIERDIETKIPDTSKCLVLYCGGGFRSLLAGENLQKMGYTNIISMDGGIRAWIQNEYPVVSL